MISESALQPIVLDSEIEQDDVQSPPIYVDVEESAPVVEDVVYPDSTGLDQQSDPSESEQEMVDNVVQELLASMPEQQPLDDDRSEEQGEIFVHLLSSIF
jgi:hypothetical protein